MKLTDYILLAIILLLGSIVVQQAEQEVVSLGATNPVAGQTYYLAGSGMSSIATSFTLTSFTITQNNAEITDAQLSDTFYMTIEPGNRARQEIVGCTTVVQNADDTATISGCTRGLSPVTPYGETASLKFTHAGGAAVILSDPPQLFEEYGALQNDETITGSWQAPDPTNAQGLATKSYVDDNVNGGAVSLDSISVGAMAGDTIATGTIVYFDNGGSNRWEKAEADDATTYTQVLLGIAQGAGTDGTAIAGGVLTRGYDETQSGLTGGQTLYLSDTAGATSTTAGTVSIPLGVAKDTSVFYFDPITLGYLSTNGDYTINGAYTFTNTVNLNGSTKGGFYATATADIAFTGATTPQAAYIYASSTDTAASNASTTSITATSTTAFSGFAITSVSAGEEVKIQTGGIVGGFSGLDRGEKYWTSTNGTIVTTTEGTNSVPVGTAVSDTEILIELGKRYYVHQISGLVDSGNAGATVVTETLNPGFIPRIITFFVPDYPESASLGTNSMIQKWVRGTISGGQGQYYMSSVSTPTTNGFSVTVKQASNGPANTSAWLFIEE